MIRRCVFATLLALCVPAVFLGGQSAADSSCVYSYSKGSGINHLSWCVSTGGNIVRFRSPLSDHIGTAGAFGEGLLVCQFPAGRVAYDTGIDQAGWSGGGPVLINDSPLIIERIAMNPATGTTPLLSVRQKFTTDYAERELLVDITVENISGVVQHQLAIARVSDLNVESSINNFWHNTPGGAWAARDGSGVVMGSVPKDGGAEAFVSNHVAFLECLPERFGGPSGPVTGDFVGVVNFSIGTLKPGQSKTFKMSYRRY